jgi:hypothetical protein
MNDDWRLRIVVSDAAQAGQLTEALRAHALADEVERSIHDRVIVSVDGAELFCYAGTREQADHAQDVIARVAAEHAWTPVFELRHWHPTAEQWEDPDVPLPDSDAARAEEQRQRVEQERAESLAQGYPEYEVRVQCGSRGEAVELAERLRSEGLQVVHRWSAVLLGALDEDSAGQLADRLRAEAPNTTVTVEGNMRAIYNERPWRPYSVLGGMGG